MNFESKTVIITGATGGIGGETVKKFLSKGANVLATDIDSDNLKTMEQAMDHGGRLKTFLVNVTKEADIQSMFNTALDAFGSVDILINNAGYEGKVKPFEDQATEDYHNVMKVNVDGVFYGMKYAFKHMKKGSVILNVSSVAGLRGSANVAPYIASKHAVSGLTKTGALEGGPKGIRVNSIHPSPVDNRMMRSLEEGFAPGQGAAAKESLEAGIPLGRYATNEDVANLIVFLASDEAAFINGVQYRIDGGMGAS